MSPSVNRSLVIAALVLACLSVLATGYPLLTIAVILLAVAELV